MERFDWTRLLLVSGADCCTVMHEAVVAQLYPQDQCFLSCSAVPLHQKTREKRTWWRNRTLDRKLRKRCDGKKARQSKKGLCTFPLAVEMAHLQSCFFPVYKYPEASRATQHHTVDTSKVMSRQCSLVTVLEVPLQEVWMTTPLAQVTNTPQKNRNTIAMEGRWNHAISAFNSAAVTMLISFLCFNPVQSYQSVSWALPVRVNKA